ncbi:MAG: porin [Chlorobium sp.]|jgi:hypothetical protein|nr:porin [Chlorobium sp.]
MKKMLSLAAMFAVLSYASPASAELKLTGDAAVRARADISNTESTTGVKDKEDNLLLQYRIRLKAAADLGDGYFFKALVQSEENAANTLLGGGWSGVGANNGGAYNLEVSNFYFGRTLKECHYSIGRLPLNSFNNPIFDLALYAVPTWATPVGATYSAVTRSAVDIPVSTWNFDRLFGFNYGGKVGDGELNGTLVAMDDNSADNNAGEGNGLLNDGYVLHLSYKTTTGNVTLEPQALISLTNVQAPVLNSTPYTFGLNATIPSGKSKIGASAFYTVNKDTTPAGADVDYTGYLLRLKGESGPATAWIDYNSTTDKSAAADVDYTNVFIWAQYNFKMHESATGSFSLTPTLRYRTSEAKDNVAATTKNNDQLRAELYATVTF